MNDRNDVTATARSRPGVYFTVDLEQDCPPYLNSTHGMERGFPLLLDLLAQLRVPATFFTTGDVARRFPDAVRDLLAHGHELGCHGMSHGRFTQMDRDTAAREITESSAILRSVAPVVTFRAPYLSLRDDQLDLLVDAGYRVDASLARYKPAHRLTRRGPAPLVRLQASVTPSLLRLPRRIREPFLLRLRNPVVLFVHPWEFVDFTAAKSLPLDCRFNTGDTALRRLGAVLEFFRDRGASFHCVRDAAVPALAAA